MDDGCSAVCRSEVKVVEAIFAGNLLRSNINPAREPPSSMFFRQHASKWHRDIR